jgi:uncharacterized protein DUF998
MLRKILLGCGIVSSALYVATDILAARRFPGYRYTEYSISEQIAEAAPTRRLWVAMTIPSGLLVAAMGAGVWASAPGRKRRAARATGAALIGYAASSVAGGLLFPLPAPRGMPSPEPQGAQRARQHVLVTAVINVFFLLSMGFGATLLGKRFRYYTYGTMATLSGFGALAGSYIPRLAADRPTPGLGIVERINVYASMLWLAALPAGLLRGQGPSAARGRGRPAGIWRRVRQVWQRVPQAAAVASLMGMAHTARRLD